MGSPSKISVINFVRWVHWCRFKLGRLFGDDGCRSNVSKVIILTSTTSFSVLLRIKLLPLGLSSLRVPRLKIRRKAEQLEKATRDTFDGTWLISSDIRSCRDGSLNRILALNLAIWRWLISCVILESVELFVRCQLLVKGYEHRCVLSALSLLAVVTKRTEEALLELIEWFLENHG